MTASSATTPTDLTDLTAGDDDSEGLIEGQERRWISAAANGDLRAFEKLMALHEERIFQLCLRLLNCREDALEASQDVFVRAYHALPRFQARAKFSTWLCQIAVNRCRDKWKHSSSRFSALCDALHLSHICQNPAPDALAETLDDLAVLEKGLQSLPRKYREVLILAAVENLPHTECAAILKCSERAIEGRLYRARKLLQGWWNRHART